MKQVMNKKDQAYNELTKVEQRLVAELDNRGEGVSHIRQWIDSQKNHYPKKPIKPRVEHIGDLLSTGAQLYLTACLAYDEENHMYELAREKYDAKQREIENALTFFVKDQAGLFNIPVIYQAATWTKALSDGHSDGWESVCNHLCSLVEIFENKL